MLHRLFRDCSDSYATAFASYLQSGCNMPASLEDDVHRLEEYQHSEDIQDTDDSNHQPQFSAQTVVNR